MREYILSINDKDYNAKVKKISSEKAIIEINGEEYDVKLKQLGRKEERVSSIRKVKKVEEKSKSKVSTEKERKISVGEGSNTVSSPLPGVILEVYVQKGQKVKAGEDIVVMESMKMENQIQAPYDGTIEKIFIKKGKNVLEGDPIVEISRHHLSTL